MAVPPAGAVRHDGFKTFMDRLQWLRMSRSTIRLHNLNWISKFDRTSHDAFDLQRPIRIGNKQRADLTQSLSKKSSNGTSWSLCLSGSVASPRLVADAGKI